MRHVVRTCNLLHVGPTLAGVTIVVLAVVGSLLNAVLAPPQAAKLQLTTIWGTSGGNEQQSYFSSVMGPPLCVSPPLACPVRQQHARVCLQGLPVPTRLVVVDGA